jgi:hypothetical protein
LYCTVENSLDSIDLMSIMLTVPERQMFRMRQDIQKHGARQLSRREERARSVRGIYRGGACGHSFRSTQKTLLMRGILPSTDQTAHGRGEEPKASRAARKNGRETYAQGSRGSTRSKSERADQTQGRKSTSQTNWTLLYYYPP